MSEDLRTGAIIEVSPWLFGFSQAVILYLIPPDQIEVTPYIEGKIPRAGGTISTTDVVKVIEYLEPEVFVSLNGQYRKEYLLQCLSK